MEPIAVDAPVKVPTIPGPKPVPLLKAEPPKVDAPKAEPTPEQPAASGWALPTRRQLTIGAAAVCSLVAGIAAVRMFSPGSSEPTTAAPTQPLTAAASSTPPTVRSSTPTEPPAPAIQPVVRPTPSTGGLNIPAVTPELLPLPKNEPPTRPLPTPTATIERTPVATNVVPPITPTTPNNLVPVITPTQPNAPVMPSLPDTQFNTANSKKNPQGDVSPVTTAGGFNTSALVPPIAPAGAQEPPQPPVTTTPPTGPGMLPLPTLPGDTAKPMAPTLPNVNVPKVEPIALPGTNPVVPPKVEPLPGTNPVVTPKVPDVNPMPPANTPSVLPPMNPTPPLNVVPPIVPTTTNVVPPINPAPPMNVVPPIVPTTNPGAVALPGVTPTDPNPGARTIEYVKPMNVPEVRPAVTSFDVDLYDPRVGDSYESISKEFYNDARYAAALREFNRNKPLQGSGQVEVPPMHVLRKRYPQSIGGGTTASPTSFPSAPPPVRPVTGTVPDNWSGSGNSTNTDLTFRSSASTYRVPAGGTTLKQIAKETLGSDARWEEIWRLNNTTITAPDALLPSGMEVKLPPGAKTGP